MTRLFLRGILGLLGIGITMLGINVGFGGIATLGWQGATDFATIAQPDAYAVQDNHVRFLGGFWLGAGLIFMLGALWPERLRSVLIGLCLMIVMGGVARLSALDPTLILSRDIAPSLIAEFVLFPLIAIWLYKLRA